MTEEEQKQRHLERLRDLEKLRALAAAVERFLLRLNEGYETPVQLLDRLADHPDCHYADVNLSDIRPLAKYLVDAGYGV